MKNRLHIFIILLVCLLSAGCDNHIDDVPMPEEFQMQDGEFEGLGEDPEFGRNANEMPRPLTQTPLYAIEIEPVLHHTMGGIKINSKAEVINNNGNSVPGLYAAGEVTGGVHGGNRLGGNAVTDIIVFGKIAGSSAVHYINQSHE